MENINTALAKNFPDFEFIPALARVLRMQKRFQHMIFRRRLTDILFIR